MIISKILLGSLMIVALAGCATTKQAESPLQNLSREQMRSAINDALVAEPAQGLEATVAQLDSLAKANPTSGLPWSYIAKVRFDQEQYGPAIVAADEALQREPDDFVAKSIRVVGGLRIALQSLADIKDNALLAGNARTDAQALADAMRESLGQDVLFPKGKPPVRPRGNTRNPPRPAAQSQPQPPAASQAPAAQPATPAGASESRNPFEGLLNTLPN